MCCQCIPFPVCPCENSLLDFNLHKSSSVMKQLFFPLQVLVTTATITLHSSLGCDCNGASPGSQVTEMSQGKPENNSECKCPVVNLCTQCQIRN